MIDTAAQRSGPDLPVVLIVDDQPSNIAVLYAALKDHYELFMALDGPAALRFCANRPPDLILLDQLMPGMSGSEVCTGLKADAATADIPIIFVTGQNTPEDEAAALEQGASDFIAKPFHASVLLARVRLHMMLKKQADALHDLALIDGLTGVHNRRYFDTALAYEWQRSERSDSPLALIMLDIDYFKNYNDRYGHVAGDGCLRCVAQALRQCLSRPGDRIMRYGGEEFVCVLPDTDAAGALLVAVAMVSAVQAMALAHAGSETAPVVTVSAGVAARAAVWGKPASDLLHAADSSLYQAKSQGRNCARAMAAASDDAAPARRLPDHA